MFGFVVGTLCLIGLVKMLRRGRHGRGGFGYRRFLNRVFSRLETSASQEKVLVGAADEMHQAMRGLREEMAAARGGLAELLEQEQLTEADLAALFARHDEAIAKLRLAAQNAVLTTHQTLDGQQRARLSRLLRRGGFPGRRGFAGPYREAVSV